mmetsp:Transcript_50604/g.109205  ORF Transcript_50604/g.109205 Transcript_50604/m.109205 type:complete len:515 (+) Transcript_50604:89-1633(+)
MEQAGLLSDGWGNIEDVLNAPINPPHGDTSWFMVPVFWLLSPFLLIAGLFGSLCQCLFSAYAIGYSWYPSCLFTLDTMFGAVLNGRPWYSAIAVWRAGISAVGGLLIQDGRLGLFHWERETFGNGRWWFHGEGVWNWTYADCVAIMKSHQNRRPAFGCIEAAVPDIFSRNLLIFLPNPAGESEWSALRHALHDAFLDWTKDAYTQRLTKLRDIVKDAWPSPKKSDWDDKTLLRKVVSKSVFYMLYGVVVTDEEATILSNWRAYASIFVIPRSFQRLVFNLAINMVKKLRRQTVLLIDKYQLRPFFTNMNNSLPEKYRRKPTVQLADEIGFLVGFAGIGGTCAAVETIASFLQNKIPEEANKKYINFGEYNTYEKMTAAFIADPESYIRESCRLDPPVTSATTVLQQETMVTLSGRQFNLKPGLLWNYALSLANRDPEVFSEPETFNPRRTDLLKALTWNGAFGNTDENEFHRICPGRYLSMDVIKVVVSHGLGMGKVLLNNYRDQEVPGTSCTC